MKIVGIDVGSTTVKAMMLENDEILWRDYQRHNTRQAEKVLEFLSRMEAECALEPGRDVVYFTGSGSGFIAPLVGGKLVQEVVAVAAAVEKLHPEVGFVSEIGGEDMKTIFFTPSGPGKSKQVYMQSACSGGTGTFIEKTARKLQIAPERLAQMTYRGWPLHKISSKCGIFAEADANTLVKAGVPVEEIIASLFEAVVQQNLATLTKGNTPTPEVLLLGGPNLFFKGLQEAWRHHLQRIWSERRVAPPDRAPDDLHPGPVGRALLCEPRLPGGRESRRADHRTIRAPKGFAGGSSRASMSSRPRKAARAWSPPTPSSGRSCKGTASPSATPQLGAVDGAESGSAASDEPVLIGCDFGSTTAKAVVVAPDMTLRFTCYVLSKGNPIEDAKDLFRQIREAGFHSIGALALTGYGKDLLKDIVGADVAVVETVAHARAALHFFPDADVICDVGGCDVKIMLLRHGAVTDFRLNSQCSSGNGAFLQGVAERYGVPLESYAERAFQAKSAARARHGMRRVPAVRHRQPAAQGLVRRGDHGLARRRAAAQCLGLCRPAAEPARGRAQVRAAGRHAPQSRGGQGAGRFHHRQGPRRGDRDPPLLRRGRRDRRGALRAGCVARRSAEPLPRLRRHRSADLSQHHQRGHDLPLVRLQLQAHIHRRRVARGEGTAVEQGSRRGRLGTRHQRQFLPERPGRGRRTRCGS